MCYPAALGSVVRPGIVLAQVLQACVCSGCWQTGGVHDFGTIKLQAPVCQDISTHSNFTFPRSFMEIYVRLLLQLLNLSNDFSLS